MSDIAVRVESASKIFKLYDDPITGPVKDILFGWTGKKVYKPFAAVDSVSFEVKKGEILGIIGANGAGKTTLLKMIAGLLPLNSGSIEVRGKITALLALGVGIHPEFTGRENIYYSGILLGMKRDVVLSKMNSIIEFSELGEFIDKPFRTYSSGMKARLLFSISMSIDPDILIVDEALATGDAYFVNKCRARISEICRSGATILFVSHNLQQIEQLCSRALLMAHGKIVGNGSPSDMIAAYNRWIFEKEGKALNLAGTDSDLVSIGGNGEIAATRIDMRNAAGELSKSFKSGERVCLEINYSSIINAETELFVGFLKSDTREYIGEFNTCYHVKPGTNEIHKSTVAIKSGEGIVSVVFDPLLLLNGHYSLWIIFYDSFKGYYCDYKGVSPFFVAREANPSLKDAVFWQPGVAISGKTNGSAAK